MAKGNFNIVWLWFLPVLIFSSCQKVVNIDLNASNPNLVVEAYLSDQSLDTVFLSKTINFDESNVFPPVSGASVIITDDAGNIHALQEFLPGTYLIPGIEGIPGRVYSLDIITDGVKYSAHCKMPEPVLIDSLFLQTGYFGDKSINIRFRDTAGVNNYYRFVNVVNGEMDESIHITDDRLQDGNEITYPLELNEGSGVPGDTITVFLQSIDKPVFDYFRTLLQLRRGGQSAAPANPQSNMSNNALGYFSAYSVRSKTIIIK
jgi:hypothetical protein